MLKAPRYPSYEFGIFVELKKSKVNDETKIKCSKIGYRSSRTMSCQATLYLRKSDKVGIHFSGNFQELTSKVFTVFEGTLLKKDYN